MVGRIDRIDAESPEAKIVGPSISGPTIYVQVLKPET
jgi:hypothetical protein